MKTKILLLLLICTQWCLAQKYWIGSVNSDWNNAGNWSPSAPNTTDNVVVDACSNCPVLSSNVTLASLALGWGAKISLNGKTATVGILAATGAEITSNGGTIDAVRTGAYQNNVVKGAFTLKINRDGTNNYLGAQLGANTYEGDFMLECHTGDWTTYGVANQYGDTYWGATTFKNIGTGWLMIASNPSSAAVFKNIVIFHNAHSFEGKIQVGAYGGRILCEQNAYIKDETVSPYSYMTIGEGTFNEQVEIDTKSGAIGIGYQNTTTFKKNVTLTNRINCNVYLGSTTGQVVFEKAATLALSSAVPMNRGLLSLQWCTFQGDATTANTPINLLLGRVSSSAAPTTYIHLSDQVTFNKPVKIRADYIYYNKVTFGYDAELERTGSSNMVGMGYSGGLCPGFSTFMGKATFINTYGDDWILQGQGKDTFKGDVSYYQHSHPWGALRLSYIGDTVYEGNLTVTSPAGATNGISWGEGGGTTQLLTGKSLTINSSGNGWISLANFNQNGGTVNPSFNVMGTSLYINNCTFNSPITVESSRLFISNSTFSQSSFVKIGNGIDISSGGNTFKKRVFLKNASATGQIQFVNQNNTINNL